MRASSFVRLRDLLLVLLCGLVAGCVVHRLEVTEIPVTSDTPITVESPVKAHLRDGSTVVFPEGIEVAEDIVRGSGQKYDLTLSESTAVSEISLADVAAMESYQTPVSTGATTAASIGGTTGIIIGGTLAMFALFGSCPTVYSLDTRGELLEAELFSYSIAPSFQARDIDRLGITPRSRVVELDVRNEMLETHYIDHLQLLRVDHRQGESAYPDHEGRPLVVAGTHAPLLARDSEGRDVLADVTHKDSRAWEASDDRVTAVSEDELLDHLYLEFEVQDVADPALILRLRNSLLSTVLFYDVMLKGQSFGALDWLGRDLDALPRKWTLGHWYRKHMGLKVAVWKNGAYRDVAQLGDQGPIAWSERAVSLGSVRGERVRVRLSFVADSWRFDQIMLAPRSRPADGQPVPVHRAISADGTRDDIPPFLSAADNEYLITRPGDSVRLQFDVGSIAADSASTLLLESNGYYVEWMRSEWLTQERRPAFKPGDAALKEALSLYAVRRQGLREQFEATKIPTR